ncbi:Endo-1,4-beta-xylanase A precursor [Alloactinosynnema sp. L-07]|uniref:hypothetical protein n=1 Tax=Alloactinosynnema sp. L-07 TaxID=1653480 RepID=UPI00065F048D|nr:hypothetical protein [Alloactinosynnema sp. L-07]CRK62101.1 Endo-1,4-beta-xylanase A precursor [Alloactinosynnema sp. L-07]
MRLRKHFAAALLALTALVGLAGHAAAQAPGVLVVTPGESVDAVPVRLTTEKGCPRPATGYMATMKGHGLDNVNVVATSDVGISFSESFEVHLAYTFKDFAADNNTTLQGKYDITLTCVDMFTQQAYGSFVATVDFPQQARYVAQGKSKGPQQHTKPAVPGMEEQSVPQQGGQPGLPGQPTQPGQAAPEAQPSPQDPDAAAQPAPASGDGTQPFLYLAGGVLALIAVAFAVSSFRKRAKAPSSESASE